MTGDRKLRSSLQLPGQDSNLDKQNQNPFENSPNVFQSHELRIIVDDGCTDGCTTSPDSAIPAAPSPVPVDPRLARLVAAWPALAEAVQERILSLLDSPEA